MAERHDRSSELPARRLLPHRFGRNVLFIEVIRRYLDSLGSHGTGSLSGLRDPLVGRALSLLHARPTDTWTPTPRQAAL